MSTNLIAIPVYNEQQHIANVLRQVLGHDADVLVVDDGSTDATPSILKQFPTVKVLRHPRNYGYGRTLRDAFQFARDRRYDYLVTVDSDGQHETSLIPTFFEMVRTCDIASGSRYLQAFDIDTPAPAERQRINLLVTDALNASLGLSLTDSFCGFKGYRISAVSRLRLTEDGYAMPLELWVQAACQHLSIVEIPVPRVYFDPKRSFGETLDDADARLGYYQTVIDRAIADARSLDGCGLETGTAPILQPVSPA